MSLTISPKLRLAPLWPALAAIVAAAATAIALLPEPLAEEAGRDLEHSLLLAVQILPAPIPGLRAPDEGLQRRLSTISAGTGYRVTVVARDGTVLADTARRFDELSAVENHLARPEIAAALARGTGRAHRRSPTTGTDSVYAARLVTAPDGTAWVARLARPAQSLAALRGSLVRIELVAAGIAGLAAWLISLWLTRSLFRPLSELIVAADHLAAGGEWRRPDVPDSGELTTLGRALERIARQNARQVAAVAAERDHLHATVASMSEGVLVVGGDGTPELVNPAFRTLFGIAAGAAAAETLDLTREPRLVDLIAGVLRSNQPAALAIERHEPAPHTVALLASPLAASTARANGVVVLARDLSESERLHQMRRDFVANVSHELKTPLAAIRGYAETLVDGAVDERATALRFSERILEQCRRLSELLDDLLTLSRLESTEPFRTTAPVALAALAEEAIELVAGRAATRQVEVALTAAEPLIVTGDAEGLLRLFTNLLDNAIKYNREAGRVEVRLLRRDALAVIEVQDQGIGIAPAHLPRIFERFYRVDSGRTRESGGTGLGLAIVKHVAQAHGGRVEVASEPGRGSTFRVYLPLAA
jgi:two-component system, OmpR family, phosphate regulon sensor histidine kinase PhoR